MGNVAGRDDGVGGEDDDGEVSPEETLAAAPELAGFIPGVAAPGYSRAPMEAAVDVASLPRSPGRSLSPRTFVPQNPVPPMQMPADPHQMFNQILNEQQEELDGLPAEEIPALIVWALGGKSVAVEGSWDNWTTQKPLTKAGKDYSLLLGLPSGVYRYRFVVDGVRRYHPDLPFEEGLAGEKVNILDINDSSPDNVESISGFVPPSSPEASYSFLTPDSKEFSKEPPVMPPQLYQGTLATEGSENASKKPQHIVLNHLYIERGWTGQQLVALGITHRFQAKFVTFVLYKSIARQHC